MKNLNDYILLTGATGLLGQYLLRDLQNRGRSVAVVVRGNKKYQPSERVEQTMQRWEKLAGKPLPRPVVLDGDITKKQFGLSQEDLAWAEEYCGSMMHSAASLTFHTRGDEPWRSNVEGTQNALDLCEQTRIRHMHYVSTAYTCGHRTELVMEDDLDVGQEFRNDYEKSKFEAEKRVREADFDCTTIYRPVVITGDSETGYTSTYHGTYLYMRMAKLLASHVDPDENGMRHVSVRWGLKGNERRNITPVDWNSEVICQLFENQDAHGKCFHLGPDRCLTMKDAIEFGCQYYKLTGIEFAGFGDKPTVPLTDLEKWIWANISIYGSYDFMDPEFDCTNLKKYTSLPCPDLDWENAKRLMDYAEEDQWGKRKPEPTKEPQINVDAFLDGCRQESSGEVDYELGLVALGPGGGCWKLRLSEMSLSSYERGLPLAEADSPVLTVPAEMFAKLKASPSKASGNFVAQAKVAGNPTTDLAERLVSALTSALVT